MKSTILTAVLILMLPVAAVTVNVSQAGPVGTVFTYQGRLIDANATADGHYDFEFAVYDSPADGNQLGPAEKREDFDVIDGYFTVELDFGAAVFTGDERWLEIGVRPGELNDPNDYTTLDPRQRVNAAPYALYALSGPQGEPGDSRWLSSGANIYYIEGNVGIGTDIPNSKLEAIGSGPTPSIFAFNAGTGPAIAGESHQGDGIAGESTDPNRSGVSGHSVNGVGVTGRSEENNGVVGWTNVADKSGVYGWSEIGAGVTGRSEAVSGRGLFGVATDTNGVGVYGKSDNGHAGYFEGNAYFSGNVGIGTTEPDGALHIADSGSVTYIVLENLIAWAIGSNDWGDFLILDDIRTRFRIESNGDTRLAPVGGNVGIGDGVFSSSEKLEIMGGGIKLTDEWSSIYGKNLKIWGDESSNLLLQPAGGGVGIGTLTPAYELDVNGNIRAMGSVYYGGTEGSTDGTAYNKPDYVFEEGYSVMTTDQVEDYLKKENHLPWMTSAKQEEQQHASVIDMTRMAFETVETAENLQMQLIQINKLLKQQADLHNRQLVEKDAAIAALKTEIENINARLGAMESIVAGPTSSQNGDM